MAEVWVLDQNGEPFRSKSISSPQDNEKQLFWERVKSPVKLRRLSVGMHAIWAIGKDCDPYLFVRSKEVPIRVIEETFENQRWTPFLGFSKNLLPTDRNAWSNAEGTDTRSRETFVLPSAGWAWEQPWMIDTSNFLQCDKQGWQYAFDFPSTFYPQCYKTSCVRRRRWIRTRRYIALNRWNKLTMPADFPLVDITIGGHEISGQTAGYYSVWALTANGKALFRMNVNASNPEGDYWLLTETEDDVEFNQITCCVSIGNVLAVTWDGRLFLRKGIGKNSVSGTHWEELYRPRNDRVLNAALGEFVAWVVTLDGKVWYANVNRGSSSPGISSESDWVEMGVQMSYVSITWNEQVFGLNIDDNQLYFRTGVTPQEFSGKAWVKVALSVKSVEEEISFVYSDMSDEESSSENAATNDENGSSRKMKGRLKKVKNVLCNLESTARSWVNKTNLESTTRSLVKNRFRSTYAAKDSPASSASASMCFKDLNDEILSYENDILGDPRFVSEALQSELVLNTDSRVRVEERIVLEKSGDFVNSEECRNIEEINPQNHDSSENNACQLGNRDSIINLNDVTKALEVVEDVVPSVSCRSGWQQVSSGGCLNADIFQRLFSGLGSGSGSLEQLNNAWLSRDLISTWRENILLQLQKRNTDVLSMSGDYELAIDSTAWLKTVNAKLYRSAKEKWFDIILEMETKPGAAFSTLTVYFKNAEFSQIEVPMCHVKCVLPAVDSADFACYLFSQYSIESASEPMKLAFLRETDRRCWVDFFEVEMLKPGPPLPGYQQFFSSRCIDGCVLALSENGMLFCSHVTAEDAKLPISQLKWMRVPGHFASIDVSSCGISWAIGEDGNAWSCFDLKNDSFRSVKNKCQTDTVIEQVYENQRWSAIKGFTTFTCWGGIYHGWSDKTGLVKRTKDSVRLPDSNWEWLGKWSVDRSDDCDEEGWQYAKSFSKTWCPTSKGCRLRRRAWVRKCRYSNPNTLWSPVDGPKLRMVSVQKLSANNNNDPSSTENGTPPPPLFVWAITRDGDVLCRMGVSVDQPQGTTWRHVIGPCHMTCISAGSANRTWATGSDGAAYLRSCANIGDILDCGWVQVPAPLKQQKLVSIAAGTGLVYGLDDTGALYWREGVSKRVPQGTDWRFLYSDVCSISLTWFDELWVTMNYAHPSGAKLKGVIARRIRVCDEVLQGTGWDYGVGGNWKLACCNGLIAS